MMMMGMVLMKVVQKMLWQVEDHGGGCGRQDTASGIDWRGVYNTTYCINRGTFNVFIDGALIHEINQTAEEEVPQAPEKRHAQQLLHPFLRVEHLGVEDRACSTQPHWEEAKVQD